MRNTDGNVDGNSVIDTDFDGDGDSDCNGSMYAWVREHDLDRQYGCTRHDTCDRQQL